MTPQEILVMKCRVKNFYPLTVVKYEEKDGQKYLIVSDRGGKLARTEIEKIELEPSACKKD